MPTTHTGAGLPSSTMESDTPTPSMDNVANLAAAIALLAQNLTSPAAPAVPWVKIRELDPFDGMDPHQLHTFLLQCALNFKEHTDAFTANEAKVTYALLFLSGSTMDCFELYLHDTDNPPPLVSSYNLFHKELESNFGLFD